MSDRTTEETITYHLRLWMDNEPRPHRIVNITLPARARAEARRAAVRLGYDDARADEYVRDASASFYADALVDWLDDEMGEDNPAALPAFLWSGIRNALDWQAFARDLMETAEEMYPAV